MFTARFSFKPDRAPEFLDDGQTVTQIDFDDVLEIIAYTQQFEEAIEDVVVYDCYTGATLTLSDFTYNI